MKVIIEAEAKEIAALVVAIQERQNIDRFMNEDLQSLRQAADQAIISAFVNHTPLKQK